MGGMSRFAVVSRMRRLAAEGGLREAVVVVGAAGFVNRLAASLAEEADVAAILSDDDEVDDDGLSGAVSGVQELANAGVIDTVALALAFGDVQDAGPLIEQLKAFPVQVTVCTERMHAAPESVACRMLGGVPLAVVADRPLQRWGLVLKTIIDKVGALILLVALSPIMIAAAVAIMMETPGPVIFRQKRRGWGGRDFLIYKFRTMYHSTTEFAFRQTDRGDARCTWVGAILRSSSLDELPQLWNVLRGDMSLVGPRPHFEAMHHMQEVGCMIVSEYAQRQRVKPGITGWAQINGLRGAVRTSDQMRRRVHYDLYYIDLYIIACTPLCLLRA